jgi:hypothetical protein
MGGSKKNFDKKGFNQHEADLAKKLGGRRQPNSGALDHRKGDVVVERAPGREGFLFDSKQCKNSTLVLAVADVTKVCREALEVQKIPGLLLTFGSHPVIVPPEWVCIPLEAFASLISKESTGDPCQTSSILVETMPETSTPHAVAQSEAEEVDVIRPHRPTKSTSTCSNTVEDSPTEST